jgi:4-amino-4-deoxy-L-arabinose transferase-like glycosyltransferase
MGAAGTLRRGRGADAEYASWARAWWPAAALIVAVTLLRVLYLALASPYTLVEDEAHYWEWARRLDWSYYSKGPGVAWTIAASDWLASRVGLGGTEFAVRLPAALFGGVLLLGVAGLARSVTRDGRAAFMAAVCLSLAPAFQVSSLLMTIDVPYAACWAVAAWCAHAALRRGVGSAWLGFGAAVGVGFLFKYTILLLVPGIVLYALVMRRSIAPVRKGRVAGGLLLASLALVPVLVWNAQHGWPTVQHLLGHLGVSGGDTPARHGEGKGWNWSPAWLPQFVGSQIAMIGPVLALMGWSVYRAVKTRRSETAVGVWADLSFLIWCAAPIIVFYLLVTLVTEPEGNWPLAGYVSLAALAGWGVLEAQRDWRRRAEAGTLSGRWVLGTSGTVPRLVWRTSIFFGVAVALLMVRLDVVATSRPMRLVESGLRALGVYDSSRPLVPLGRIMGARTVAQSAQDLRGRVALETGREPLVIAQQYGRASQLAFYMDGRPLVYCSSSRSEGRRTQYDMWEETSLDKPELLGQDAICVGGHLYQWEPAFERVVEFGMLEGEPKASRLTFIGYGFKGFPK